MAKIPPESRTAMHKIPYMHNWIDRLPQACRDAVLRQMKPRRYAEGETIYSVGEAAEGLYLIDSGRVRISNYTQSGKEIRMAEFHDGECFGEMSLIDGLPRLNNAYASTETLLMTLNRQAFDALYDEYAEIAREFNLYFSLRLRALYASAEDATALPLKERLVRLLVRMAHSRGVETDGMRVIEEVSHETLSHMLGATRQGVSRELKALEKEGQIQIRYGKILITDIAALSSRCDTLLGSELLVSGKPDRGSCE
ncbi:Crp/Fnr family transcriptional regulator [Marinobacterium nitratireducens]|uniref:Crp/Fnr family transcriptional regulator n=1 Tax=Marinobacterium nitratireducens TaxID=518897 RepID=A0A917ZIQ9_9GAMM|nr:Crp/Fnr family transcriptional regulator [Marinobacterium nitratireducens]GGO83401.1 Crp/Fnr family transcriptional regulator [Marinobacterium nitratireducens]